MTVGVVSGKLRGTFDPGNLTWQAVGTGLRINAAQVLEMAATEAGRTTLEALNIPAIEIGRTSLSGSIAGVIDVNMNDVTFFASSTGGTPEIWATGDVNGSYTDYPDGSSVMLSDTGSNIYANFNVKNWDTVDNTWYADISDGNGMLTRTDTTGTENIKFDGVAAGTHTGGMSGTFSGVGAGNVTHSESY